MSVVRVLQQSFTGFAERTGALATLDPIASKIHALTTPVFGPDANRSLRDVLYGTWLGHPLHPVVVDLPIGFWTSSAVLDLLGLDDAADTTLKLGTITSVAAAATGVAQWYDLEQMEEPRRIGTAHALLNTAATLSFAGSWCLRGADHRSAGKAASLLGLTLASAGGLLGGDLAYRLGIGVSRDAFEEAPAEWTSITPLANLPEGELVPLEHDGLSLVALRQGDDVLVTSAICTHVGAPLNEGELSGTCVTCPWHGSVFDLADGSVVHGPATTPLQSFEVRTRDGQVEIRA